ncbi:MAG: hypothetical protein IT449_12005 [Phycisphaerales bacterium]|nr:hypothetical protein [Phycisphaerales bacterium]
MPRANKAVKRQLVMAGAEYKKGKHEEAYKLWTAAAKTRQELAAKKRNKKQAAEPAAS